MLKRILIVEDSPTQALYLQEYFTALGYAVSLAYTGTEALEQIQQINPDMIILDYQLPDMDGIQVCKNFKRDLYLRIIPVIIHSAENKLRHMVKAYEAGADYYVVKDKESDRVLEVLVETVLGRRNTRRTTARTVPPRYDSTEEALTA